jgi:predicted transcriptional regulator
MGTNVLGFPVTIWVNAQDEVAVLAPFTPRHLLLDVQDAATEERLDVILRALASRPRRRILELLADQLYNVSEIAQALDMPVSTANLHVTALEEAGLLITERRPASRGSQKVCTRAFDDIAVLFPRGRRDETPMTEVSVPIGSFVDCQVTPSCGLASASAIIGLLDDPASFYDALRSDAQLLWFHQGYVEYRLAHRLPPSSRLESVHVACEVCSEAPLHHDDWPSDITMTLNGVDIGTWTSPGDFGGQRGLLTPSWWEDYNSQYGLLKVWQVNERGGWVDGIRVSDVTVTELDVAAKPYLTLRVGVRSDARHVGGVNLFGRSFGNYPQDIVVRLKYR